jgi:aspartate kinase
MILSDEFGNARVLSESYDKLNKLNENKKLMIFPGFFGYSVNGEVVTFSRGGSDVTGAVLAAAVNASIYENFTDVDSVYAANPNIINNPAPIPIFTYAEMRELSYAGFSVLHEETLEPVYRMGIPVNIRNTNNPSAPGTLIVTERKDDDTRPVVGIAADKGFFAINVNKYMMNREIGFGRRLLQILEDEGVSYEHTPSGIDSICVILREKNCNGEKLDKIIKNIETQLKVDSIVIQKDLAIAMIVGLGMMRRVGVASIAATALSESGVNIAMINQGSSEVSIMFGIDAHDSVKAVKALYDAFFYMGC